MPRPLPYPGYSWSFTQHAVGLTAKTIYDFLQCAAPFEGAIDNYSDKITSLMVASGILTVNERDGSPDAWRDYQQLLAELGLIYSTKICRALTITDVGHMFLAGEIGFSELIGVQALRYQYPNGQKATIQSGLRKQLESANLSYPPTLTELQAQTGVLLKPGLLIFRVLYELAELGHDPSLSVSECQAFLIPCHGNEEWKLALAEVINHRKSPGSIDSINHHSRRNIQDWFKFLQKSDYFIENNRGISLSDFALSNFDNIKAFGEQQQDLSNYWIPTNFDINDRLGWFRWFGSVPYSAQTILRTDTEIDESYLKENFVAGMEDERDDDKASPARRIGLNLKPIDFEHLDRETQLNSSTDIAQLVENLLKGAQKRHAKTLMHDRIIKDLASTFASQGASVESDHDSIDLFASWPNGHSAIFEVKTVTHRSLQGRLRSAIGQIEEYSYRRQCSGHPVSDRVIVINTSIESHAWQRSFLTDHLGIGLICKPTNLYSAFAPVSSLTKGYWLSL